MQKRMTREEGRRMHSQAGLPKLDLSRIAKIVKEKSAEVIRDEQKGMPEAKKIKGMAVGSDLPCK